MIILLHYYKMLVNVIREQKDTHTHEKHPPTKQCASFWFLQSSLSGWMFKTKRTREQKK